MIDSLFCVQTTTRNPDKQLFINIKGSDLVQQPNLEHFGNVEKLVQEMTSKVNTENTKKFNIAMRTSPIFWSTEDRYAKDKHYVVDVLINDKLGEMARREVILSHYIVYVVMSILEDKYNTDDQTKTAGHDLGHKLNWVTGEYKILDDIKCYYRSEEIVNARVKHVYSSDGEYLRDLTDEPYILYYRPGSRYLTLSFHTDTVPSSFSFNDDRIIVNTQNEEDRLDITIPFFIDINEPVKFKYEESSALFRMVFRTVECQP